MADRKPTPTPPAPVKTPEQRAIEKADAFKRLAEKRVPKVIKAIKGLQPLASPNYSYTPEQVRKIVTALETELIALSTAFDRKKSGEEITFTL
jgi:hypothetical protein